MKIASFNVNGVNGRLPVLLRWLDEAEPDVVCLQELKSPDERFPRREIEKAGYGAVWHGQKSWNGVAILAREDSMLAWKQQKAVCDLDQIPDCPTSGPMPEGPCCPPPPLTPQEQADDAARKVELELEMAAPVEEEEEPKKKGKRKR